MSVWGRSLPFIEASGWQKVRSCVDSVLGCGSVLLVDSYVLPFLWVVSEEKIVETGCPKSAQEIWHCFVGLEGQGASSLLVGFSWQLGCW